MMQAVPGGATAKPFKTHHKALGIDLYLRIAPELYLKRLLVGGFEKVFEINRNFRNEGLSTRHNPEFTMLEFYQAYTTYQELMDLTEEMISWLADEVTGSMELTYQGQHVNLAPPWKRYTLEQALIEVGGIDPAVLRDDRAVMRLAADKGDRTATRRRTGEGKNRTLRAAGRGKARQPDLCDVLPDGSLSPGPVQRRRPGRDRPLRAVYHRPRDRQCLQRTQ
jgi:lysyl-tRNA synthetase, class II